MMVGEKVQWSPGAVALGLAHVYRPGAMQVVRFRPAELVVGSADYRTVRMPAQVWLEHAEEGMLQVAASLVVPVAS